jgi:hypothetical protein
VSNGSIEPYANANAPISLFGMRSISGVAETWILEAHDSFGSIEDLDSALGAVSPGHQRNLEIGGLGSRTLIALYRPGLSYRSDQAIRMFPKTRYFQISIYHTRPGTDADFAELVKLRRKSLDSINLNRPDIAYQVISGAPSGTYVFLGPLTSLRTLDNGLANSPVYADGVVDATVQASRKIAAEAEISRENLLFRIDPRLSHVSEEFAAGESEFWHSKQKP